MDVLHKYVHANFLAEFNAEADRVMGKKWKPAKTPDDLGRMRESDFLDRTEVPKDLGQIPYTIFAHVAETMGFEPTRPFWGLLP